MNFTDYAFSKGLQLLKDDIVFIRARMYKVPKNSRNAFMRRYVELWLQGMQEEENALRKQSVGRRAANNFLLANT
ncbi:MAG: hypothetical protein ACRC1W_09715 [Shewanella sp.]